MKKAVTLLLSLCMLLGVCVPSVSASEVPINQNGEETSLTLNESVFCETVPCNAAEAESTPVKGDLNGDGMITAADINLLIYAFKNGKFPCGENSHSYEGAVTTAPTCEEKGEKTFVCTECGDSYTEVLPALGHDYETVVTVPTATEDGYTTYTCHCGDSYTEAVVPVSFTVTSSNRSDIGYTGAAGENLVIPAVFEKDGVWYRVTGIGNSAFHDCHRLTGIVIPGSVTSIGTAVFAGCTDLAKIAVEEGNAQYHSAGNCLIETKTKVLVSGCKNSVIPSNGSVINIGRSAFSNCTSLISITIPESVTSIGSSAFYNCYKL